MSWAIAAGTGASLVGGMMGSSSAKRAARAQAAAIREANEIQRQQYNQTREDLGDYRDAGGRALSEIMGNLNSLNASFTKEDFEADPGYQFRLEEGQKALERSAAARGGLNTGATLKALTGYGQGMASQEYQNAYNRFNNDNQRKYNNLMGLANMGQNSAAMTGQAGANYANAVSNNLSNLGDAQGASAIAQGNAWMGAANNITSLAGMYGGQQQTQPVQNGTVGRLIASDRRLKKNIQRLSKSDYKDVPTYVFDYKDKKYGIGNHRGVMAQDLLDIDPNHPAVTTGKDGFYQVDYSKLEKV